MKLVSRADLAREIGVSRQAISSAIKRGKLRKLGEGRDVKIDMHDILTVDYIKDGSVSRRVAQDKKGIGQKKKEIEKVIDIPGETMALREEKLRAQTRKLKMEMDEKLGKLMPRDDVERAFGAMGSSLINYIFPLGDRMSAIIAGVFESTDQEKINEAKLLIDEEVSRSLEAIKRDISNLL